MVAYVASANSTNNTTGSTVTVTVPATAAAGQLALLFFVSGEEPLTQATPTGWTAIPNLHQANASTLGIDGWYKTLAAGDVGAGVDVVSNVNGTSAYKRIGLMSVYSGAALGNSQSAMESTASTTHTCPAVTTSSAGAWIVNFVVDRASPGSSSFTLPFNLTQRQFQQLAGGGAPSAVLADDDAVSAGSEGANTVTGTVSTANAAMATVALEPNRSGMAKVWNGTAWVLHPVKVWNGSAWVTHQVKGYNAGWVVAK